MITEHLQVVSVVGGLVIGALGVAVRVPASLKTLADLRKKDNTRQDDGKA